MQPYRTLPLLQPSAQPRTDLGKKAISHLKTQEDYFNMPREQPQYVPLILTAKAKQDDFMMKQKVRKPFETALASVVSVGGGEEEQGAAPRHSVSRAVRSNNEGGEGTVLQESSPSESNAEEKSKKNKKAGASSNVKKLNKSTFKIGGEIVQLKKPPENTAVSSDEAQPQIHLIRKHSAGNLLTEPDHEREEQLHLANRSAKGRSRSLGYTVYTTELDEDSDQVLLTADSALSLPPHPEVDQPDQAVECTVQLAEPAVQPEVSTVEVEHTIRLSHPKPKPEVQTVDVSQTVRVKRDYYMW